MNDTHDPEKPGASGAASDPGASSTPSKPTAPGTSGTPSTPGAPGTPGTPGTPPWQAVPNSPYAPQPSAKFFSWLRQLGIQRGSSRWVGGVCSGLSDKWGIDPVILRGLAVVLTLFFGVGLLAYGVAWALLPEPDGRIHVEEVSHGRWSTGMTGAAIATFFGLVGFGPGFIFGTHADWFPWPALWVAAIVAVIVWAVRRDKGRKYANTPNPQAADWQSTSWQGTGWQSITGHGTTGQRTTGQRTSQQAAGPQAGGSQTTSPQSAGPQAAAWMPESGNYPNPTGASGVKQYPPKKRVPHLGAAASLFSLGLAVMVGALVLILDSTGTLHLNGYQVATAAAASAMTAGIAIIISGIRGRTAAGVGSFAIVTLVLAGLLSMAPLNRSWPPLANTSWTPTSISAAEAGFTLVMGNATLDLTQIAAINTSTGTPPNSTPSNKAALTKDVKIPLELVTSKVVIMVPTSIPVTIDSDLALASLNVQNQSDLGQSVPEQSQNTGTVVAQSTTTIINPQATGYGLVVSLDGAATNVTIIRVGGN